MGKERKTELLGCIAPVQTVEEKNDGIFGSNSKAQLKKLLEFVGNDDVEMEIV
jgi:hypothetical protein